MFGARERVNDDRSVASRHHERRLPDLYMVAGRLGKQRRNLWYPASLYPDYCVTDGDQLPGFEQWRVVETPGHTDRELSLLHIESNKVHVVDLIVKVKKSIYPAVSGVSSQ